MIAPQDRGSQPPRYATILLNDTADVVGLPPSQKIGKKLSEHSKEDSFNAVDAAGPGKCSDQGHSLGSSRGSGSQFGIFTRIRVTVLIMVTVP